VFRDAGSARGRLPDLRTTECSGNQCFPTSASFRVYASALTGPTYAQSLINLMRQYNFYRFDR